MASIEYKYSIEHRGTLDTRLKPTLQLGETFINGCTVRFKPIRNLNFFLWPGHEFSHKGEPLAKFWVAGADGH